MSRAMEITTPLKRDVLLFHHMTVHEELGRLSEFQISLLSTRGDIDLNEIMAGNITVKLELPNYNTRYYNGYVTRFSQTGTHGRHHLYQATVRPWLWFLTRTSDCRIFQNMTVPDIIQQVFNDHKKIAYVKKELTGSYRKYEYCVQYRETDFNFVSRLMEQEGIYYYFKHEDGKHWLILSDSYVAHSSFKGYEKIPFILHEMVEKSESDSISDWNFTREIQPGCYIIDDYDAKNPTTELQAQAKAKNKREYDLADYEIYDYPGEYVKPDEGKEYADIRIEELQVQHESANGGTTARGICSGYLFKLTGHVRPDQNREYLIVSTVQNMELGDYESTGNAGTNYSCSFTVLNIQESFRSQRSTPKPIVQGPQTAVITGPSGDEIYTDEHGRVKVQFHWDRYGKSDENSSCWIRVSQVHAGKGFGGIDIPRIGEEVIIEFLEGDPDRPIITGRVYNGDNKPPTGLPTAGMVSGLKSNSTPGGGGHNSILLDDTKEKEKLSVHAQYDMDTTVQHDQTNTVNNTFTETIKSDTTVNITEGKYVHDVMANTANYHVQGALTEVFDTTQETTVASNITTTSTTGAINITANTFIQLQVGASKIYMDAGGNITIEGVNVVINGKALVTTKGGIVHSQADAEHQTTGAIVVSDGSASNTVKGGVVMLNP